MFIIQYLQTLQAVTNGSHNHVSSLGAKCSDSAGDRKTATRVTPNTAETLEVREKGKDNGKRESGEKDDCQTFNSLGSVVWSGARDVLRSDLRVKEQARRFLEPGARAHGRDREGTPRCTSAGCRRR